MGESLGGLVLKSGLTDSVFQNVDGVVLCGALLELAPALRVAGFAIPIIRLLSFLRPTFALPVTVGGETYDRAFADPACARLAREDTLTLEIRSLLTRRLSGQVWRWANS